MDNSCDISFHSLDLKSDNNADNQHLFNSPNSCQFLKRCVSNLLPLNDKHQLENFGMGFGVTPFPMISAVADSLLNEQFDTNTNKTTSILEVFKSSSACLHHHIHNVEESSETMDQLATTHELMSVECDLSPVSHTNFILENDVREIQLIEIRRTKCALDDHFNQQMLKKQQWMTPPRSSQFDRFPKIMKAITSRVGTFPYSRVLPMHSRDQISLICEDDDGDDVVDGSSGERKQSFIFQTSCSTDGKDVPPNIGSNSPSDNKDDDDAASSDESADDEKGKENGDGAGNSGNGDGCNESAKEKEKQVAKAKLPRLEFTMVVEDFQAKANTAATMPEVSPLYGDDTTGHWRLLVYPRSHRGDEQWCSTYLAAAVDVDSLGHGWWKKVDFSISAIHPNDPNSNTVSPLNASPSTSTTATAAAAAATVESEKNGLVHNKDVVGGAEDTTIIPSPPIVEMVKPNKNPNKGCVKGSGHRKNTADSKNKDKNKKDHSKIKNHHKKDNKEKCQTNASVTRRGTNTFKGRGTSLAHNFEWGYNDLIKVDTLVDNGFLAGTRKPDVVKSSENSEDNEHIKSAQDPNDDDTIVGKGRLVIKVELTVLESKPGVPYADLSASDLQDDLIWAVGVAAVPMVKECLNCNADPSQIYDTKKQDTPLHKAASTPGWRPGAAEVVSLLLDAGAAVNAVNDLEETPLLLAADVSGCAEICYRLLMNGANPTFRTDNGWSPMNCAAKRGRDDIINLLIRFNCPLEEPTTEYSAILHAAAQGHTETVLLLLKCGAEANVADRHGDTALWKLVDQDLSEIALTMVQDYHASIARCSRDRKKVTKARLMLKHAEKKKKLTEEARFEARQTKFRQEISQHVLVADMLKSGDDGGAGGGGDRSVNLKGKNMTKNKSLDKNKTNIIATIDELIDEVSVNPFEHAIADATKTFLRSNMTPELSSDPSASIYVEKVIEDISNMVISSGIAMIKDLDIKNMTPEDDADDDDDDTERHKHSSQKKKTQQVQQQPSSSSSSFSKSSSPSSFSFEQNKIQTDLIKKKIAEKNKELLKLEIAKSEALMEQLVLEEAKAFEEDEKKKLKRKKKKNKAKKAKKSIIGEEDCLKDDNDIDDIEIETNEYVNLSMTSVSNNEMANEVKKESQSSSTSSSGVEMSSSEIGSHNHSQNLKNKSSPSKKNKKKLLEQSILKSMDIGHTSPQETNNIPSSDKIDSTTEKQTSSPSRHSNHQSPNRRGASIEEETGKWLDCEWGDLEKDILSLTAFEE